MNAYTKLKIQYAKRREKARRMFESGMSAIEIAAKLGITRQRVYQIIK